jgi:hypothetical protein
MYDRNRLIQIRRRSRTWRAGCSPCPSATPPGRRTKWLPTSCTATWDRFNEALFRTSFYQKVADNCASDSFGLNSCVLWPIKATKTIFLHLYFYLTSWPKLLYKIGSRASPSSASSPRPSSWSAMPSAPSWWRFYETSIRTKSFRTNCFS